MRFLRTHFNLLSLVCYVVEFIVVVGVFGFFYPDKNMSVLRSVLMGMSLGALIGLMLWTFAKIGRFLWNMNEGLWWKLFVFTGALIFPILILVFDLNAKLVVSHLYTGSKPIPYTLRNSMEKSARRASSPQFVEIECSKCHAKMLDDEAGPLKCFSCGMPIRD